MIPSARSIIYHNFINRSSPLIRVSKLKLPSLLAKKRKKARYESILLCFNRSIGAPGTPYRGTTIRREFGIGLEDNARVESVQRRSVAVCLGRLRITYSQRELLFDRSSARPSASMHTHTRTCTRTHTRVRTLSRSLCLLLRARTRPCTRAYTQRGRERERGEESTGS